MYFLGLLFLVFPIYFAYGEAFFPGVLLATLLFGLVYISVLYSTSKTYDLLAWCYLLVYIAVMSFWGNLQYSLFLFNLSNLLTWHYAKETWHFRPVSYGLLLASVILWSWIGGYPFEVRLFVLLLHTFGLFMLIGGRLQLRREMAEQKVRDQNASINLLLAENERNRIGQDLHDTLGHLFAMLAVKSELAGLLLEKEDTVAAKAEVAQIHALSKEAMGQVRDIIQSLKQVAVKDELQILRQMLELAGVDVQIEQADLLDHLSLADQDKLAMMLRELATNLLKHSQASTCQLLVSERDSHYQIDYVDNGVGFGQLDGTELASIRKRVIILQGDLELVFSRKPTQIRLDIPKRREEA